MSVESCDLVKQIACDSHPHFIVTAIFVCRAARVSVRVCDARRPYFFLVLPLTRWRGLVGHGAGAGAGAGDGVFPIRRRFVAILLWSGCSRAAAFGTMASFFAVVRIGIVLDLFFARFCI